MSASLSRLGFSLDRRAKAPGVWAALLAAAGLAWVVTVRDAVEMRGGPGTMGRDLGAFVLLWVTMMVAMMLPAVAPFTSLYLRSVLGRSTGALRVLRLATVTLGYLGAWTAFGVAAFAAAWAGGRLAAEAPSSAPWVGAATLAGAGIYQLTPLKARCLSHCRSPLGFVLHFGGYSGALRDVRVGLYHGAYCVGCCWSLFVVLIAVGVMNVAWMVGLAIAIFLEKTWRFGKAFGVAFGTALFVVAFFVPLHPELVPGLHTGGDMAMLPVER